MNKLGPKIFCYGTVLLVCALAGRVLPVTAEEPPRKADAVIARVNGSPLLAGEFEWQWRRHLRKATNQALSDESSRAARNAFLESLIRQELAYQAASEAGFAPDTQTIDREIKSLEKQFADERTFASELTRLGLNAGLLRRQVEKSFVIRCWINETFAAEQKVSETEAQAWYRKNLAGLQRPEQVCARHLLIKIDKSGGDTARQQARRRAEGMRQRWLAGESFPALCHQFSECLSAAREGDLGCFSRNEMVESFAKDAFALKPWDVSEVVETAKGFHLIQAYERRPASAIPYAEARGRILDQVRAAKARIPVDAFLEAKRREAVVEIAASP